MEKLDPIAQVVAIVVMGIVLVVYIYMLLKD